MKTWRNDLHFYCFLFFILIAIQNSSGSNFNGIWSGEHSWLYIYNEKFTLEYRETLLQISGGNVSELGYYDLISGKLTFTPEDTFLEIETITPDPYNSTYKRMFDTSTTKGNNSLRVRNDTLWISDKKESISFKRIPKEQNPYIYKNFTWLELTDSLSSDNEVLKTKLPGMSNLTLAYHTQNGISFMRAEKGKWINSELEIPTVHSTDINYAESDSMRYALYIAENKLFLAHQKIRGPTEWVKQEIVLNGPEEFNDPDNEYILRSQSIDIDDSGNIHIAFTIKQDYLTAKALVYGVFSKERWKFIKIAQNEDDDDDFIADYSVKCTLNGDVFVFYTKRGKGLFQTFSRKNEWHTTEIISDTSTRFLSSVSAQVRKKGNTFHLAFSPFLKLEYLFSSDTGQTWSSETVSDKAYYLHTDLGLTASGNPIMIFRALETFIAIRAQGKWNHFSLIDEYATNHISKIDFSIDHKNRLHLVYYADANPGYWIKPGSNTPGRSFWNLHYYVIDQIENPETRTHILHKHRVRLAHEWESTPPMIYWK